MDDRIVKRNLDLVALVTAFILQRPDVLDQLPDNFRPVVLPDDDVDLSRYNLSLLATQPEQDRPVVIVQLDTRQQDFTRNPPRMYAPVPIAT